MIVDTDVLIWFFRGSAKAKSVLAEKMPFDVTVVTYMELMQGARDASEQALIEQQLNAWGVKVLHLTENISVRAKQIVREYAISHSTYLADALIAATAIENNLPLLTGNKKHFKHIVGLTCRMFTV